MAGVTLDLPAADLPVSDAEREVLSRMAGDALTQIRLRGALERLPAATPPHLAAHAARMDAFWRDVDAQWGLLTAEQVADRGGSRSKSRRSYASGLRRHRRLLGLERAGRVLYPGFQFDDQGQVFPEIAQLVEIFDGQGWTDRSILLWLLTPTGQLSRDRPLDLLGEDSRRLLAAAGRASVGVSG